MSSSGAEVGRYEHFGFLFLALIFRAFCFCLSGLLEYFETYRFLLENLKVMFPFSSDTDLPYV